MVNKNEQILLLKRQNTGYRDGEWGLVSGHVEKGESMVEALLREAREEAGLDIPADELQFGCLLHRNSDDSERVDLFFVWEPPHMPEVVNLEPQKCAELKYFDLDELPENTISYVREALECCAEERPYFEYGWDDEES